ncbi:MAG TPA: 2'-5' RNA ligase family protein [Candidatus Koribacter sp.]|jgi:2'-5' RNA ligase
MQPLQYALVAYVHNQVGTFVEHLRGEIHPEHGHLAAHVTVLPPRLLRGSEEEAVTAVSRLASAQAAFEIGMGEVESFVPSTPTIFIRVARAAYRMRELHDAMNQGALEYEEPWPYMPHLTIAKLDCAPDVEQVIETARQRWREYNGSRQVTIDNLAFVRGSGHTWFDIARFSLDGDKVAR